MKLMQCLGRLETEQTKGLAKMDMMARVNELMPSGNPAFRDIIHYPTIKQLEKEYGKTAMLGTLCILINDFCNSVNVVRNMNNDQVIEAAAFLLDECDNFRLEDYVIMFTMAKRGTLDVRIMDRVDIDLINKILNAYWVIRFEAGQRIQESELQEDNRRWDRPDRVIPDTPEDEAKEKEKSARFGQLVGIMTAWQKEEREEAEKKRKAEADKAYRKMEQAGLNDIVHQLTDRKVTRPDYVPLDERIPDAEVQKHLSEPNKDDQPF